MSPLPPSGNEGYIRNRDVPYQSVTLDVTSEDRRMGSLLKGHGYGPFQCPMEASCAVTFWRRLAPIGRPVTVAMALIHSVGLDNIGKTYQISLEQERCGSPDLPEGGSEAVTHMDNSQVHMEYWR